MESFLSAIGKTNSPSKLLGHKRDMKNPLKENYLFRRIINGKTEGNYERMSNIYYNFMSFNWEEEKLNKMRTSTCKVFILF